MGDRSEYNRQYARRRRIMVINHYGGHCACCGETTLEFLVLDHKDGNGNQHRQEVNARGNGMVSWIIRNDYPDMFRVLCHNCNQALGSYGFCPHEKG